MLVKSREADDILLSFFLQGKQVNFVRKVSDLADTVIKRMKLTCSRLLADQEGATSTGKKRKGDKISADPHDVAISFASREGSLIDPHQSLHEVLLQSRQFILNDLTYQIAMNPPQPSQASLFHPFLQGCPVFYKVDVDNGSASDLVFEFSASRHVVAASFSPLAEDVGQTLKLSVYNEDYPEFGIFCTSTEPILPLPDVASFPCCFNAPLDKTEEGTLRICTFNILAQSYVTTDFAVNHMYAHVKDEKVLSFGYRNSLIFRELLNFNGDLLLLQEVTPQVVERCLVPLFSSDFNISFVGKENSQRPNGVSIVSRKCIFKQLLSREICLGGASLWSYLSESEKDDISSSFGSLFIDGVLPNLSTVASVVVLDSAYGPCIAANTHLFYHPYGAHVRLLQTIVLLRIIEGLLVDYPGAQVILGGDLNSRPSTAVINLIKTGAVDASDADWQFGSVFSWGREEEEEGEGSAPATPNPDCTGISAKHSLKLEIANQPQLTHATAGFRAVLDYIVFSRESLEVTCDFHEKQLTSQLVDRYGGLPCQAYGSDHVLVPAELRYSPSP